MSKRIAVVVLALVVAAVSFGLGVRVGMSRVARAADEAEIAARDCPEIAPAGAVADRPANAARTAAVAVDPDADHPVTESPMALLRRSLDGGVEERPALAPEAQRIADEMLARDALSPAERDALLAIMPRLSPEERAELVERILGGAADGGPTP